MRVSQIKPSTIGAQNIVRAVRFYREVFDLPAEFGANEAAHLSLHGDQIHFTLSETPTTVEVLVNDKPIDVENHFKNYYVEQTQPSEIIDGHTVFHIADFEGNHIMVVTK
ncbi:MAG: lactoylglutathione lyase [Lactobacillaceae bacterium]|jgi:predicted enzyme related to lactoylglutathione lyase|nr:lactoylglutathione lyase [Lactobacillaceae bacterium]